MSSAPPAASRTSEQARRRAAGTGVPGGAEANRRSGVLKRLCLQAEAEQQAFTTVRIDAIASQSMRIERIDLSVFELKSNTSCFDLDEVQLADGRRSWRRRHVGARVDQIHVLHVHTDDGLEGMCTVGDARYTTMRDDELEALRIMAVGQDAADRERLCDKLDAATRGLFAPPGWFGAFDNCLWDLAGKAAGQPVCELVGRARNSCPAYLNFGGATPEQAAESAAAAVARGFGAVKDHFGGTGAQNETWFRAARAAVGPKVVLMHDAAGCDYAVDEAVAVARILEELGYAWFEEPLSDRDLQALQRLCAEVEIPILAPETLMHDFQLSRSWLLASATDKLRVNARLGFTRTLQLASEARKRGTTVEANGPGGLFGLVHAHFVCAVENTGYYEYFPGGSRDEVGKEIGLLNPPLPVNGVIGPPAGPGWGAEWDRSYFEKVRKAVR
jgi:L-alanine-DL-glutamate epimerase-like enolase superfamily enzyme